MKTNSGLLAIIKKEFKRFFTDRRMVISTVLLPGVMIYAIYSFIGAGLGTMLTVDENYEPSISAVNLPASIESMTSAANIKITPVSASEVADIQDQIANKTQDLLLVFPANFDQTIAQANFQEAQSSYTPPNVELFYNSSHAESQNSYITISGLLDAYKSAQFTLFNVNMPPPNAPEASFDLATSKDSAAQFFSAMLPMLMMMFLFAGCMGVAPESIAGEKERGTIATLLVTPLKRWELALGKIISLSCIAILGGASSFIGVMLSLPKMMGSMSDDVSDNISAALYGPLDYTLLFFITISTVLLFISLISLISAFAKTIKEAGTLVMPLYIVVMLVGILGMFGAAQTDLLFYLIPAYNSVQCMVGIFSFDYQLTWVFVTIAVNLLITAVCVVILTKMFNSERVTFAK